MEFGKVMPYEVHIIPSNNKGFTVTIGCARLVFTDSDSMIDALENYLADPPKMGAEYDKTQPAEAERCEPSDEEQPQCAV